MQKKESKLIKTKRRIRPVDITIVIICLAGACFFGAAFWQEYNSTLVRLDEEPVGIIIFRKGVAQRRFIDRNMWDRLHQATPVYQGDTIRTIERSEAIVILKDQVTHLSMEERTMIQVFFDGRRGANIDFSGGYLGVSSENESVFVTSGNSTITVAGQARMNKDEEGLVISVLDGTANFDGTEIEAGGILALDSYGQIDTNPIIAMTSFGSSAFILGAHSEAVPVIFSWNSANFNEDSFVIVQVALDRGFNQIVQSKDVSDASSVSIYLESGNYWWRAFPASADRRQPASRHPAGSLEVIPTAAVHLRSPPNGEALTFRSDSLIPLSWSAVENAIAYLVEISANADMSLPVVSRYVETNSVVQTALDFGRWYWSVTPVFPPIFIGSGSVSAVSSFTVVQGNPTIAKPVLTFPLQDGRVYIDFAGGQTNHRLFWAHDQNADSWLVELADNPYMLNPVMTKNTSFNYFLLPQNLLQENKIWYWHIIALGGESPVVSAVQNFQVSTPGATAVYIPPVTERIDPVIDPFLSLPPIIFGTNVENWYDLIDAEIKANNEATLLRVVSILNSNSGIRLRIEGHANPVTNPNNTAARYREQIYELQPLSEMRARTVMNRIVELGIDPNRLEVTGLGSLNPVTVWEDTSNWWKNRRVVFALTE